MNFRSFTFLPSSPHIWPSPCLCCYPLSLLSWPPLPGTSSHLPPHPAWSVPPCQQNFLLTLITILSSSLVFFIPFSDKLSNKLLPAVYTFLQLLQVGSSRTSFQTKFLLSFSPIVFEGKKNTRRELFGLPPFHQGNGSGAGGN